MCGIGGLLSHGPGGRAGVEAVAGRMVTALRHRGPDDEGIHVSPLSPAGAPRGWLALGHTRLSIIDLSPAARQPMANEDGSLWLTFNGEIYDFQELRAELSARGHRFRSHTDSEVLLHLYEEDDEEFLARCNGMFAFALWDERRQRLVLGRDRLGVKPLVYALLPQGIAFASDVRALAEVPGVARAIDPAALLDYLVVGYVLTPRTILAGVHRLPPATVLTWQDGAVRLRRYWDPAAAVRTPAAGTEADWVAALGAALTAATRRRLVSDVPLGTFLSGGLDSSAVTREARAALGRPIETFSVSFPEPSYDEVGAARTVAAHLGCPHHYTTVPATPDAVRKALAAALDEPLADTSLVPLYYLAHLARERVTVVLSGDGGDEALGGYPTYLADRLFGWYSRAPGPVRHGVAALARHFPVTARKVGASYKLRQFFTAPDANPDRAHFWWRVLFPRAEALGLLSPDVRAAVGTHDPWHTFAQHAAECPTADPLARAQYVDLKTFLADNILAKVDRATMAHALEARAPFLDFRLMELALALPSRAKVRGLTQKVLLRRLLRDRLPAAILAAPKRGFNAPVSAWLRGPLRELGQELLASDALRETGLFDPAPVAALWAAHERGWQDQGFRLWGLVSFMVWWQTAMRRPPDGRPRA